MNRNFERAFELNLIPSDHKTISISLTNQNPDFLKPLMISIDTFGLWEAEHPNLVLSTYYPNIPQFDHNTFQANNYLFLHQPLKIFSIAKSKRWLVSSCFISNCKFQMTRCKNGSDQEKLKRKDESFCSVMLSYLYLPYSYLQTTDDGDEKDSGDEYSLLKMPLIIMIIVTVICL